VKADDLIDALEERALAEVAQRNPGVSEAERREMAQAIARGALRYFMIKYTKNKVIAFDFAEALNFEGDSGPYLQYAAVRANNLFQKMGLGRAERPLAPPVALTEGEGFRALDAEESAELWSLAFAASRLPQVAEQVRRTEEPAFLARFTLALAQKFNAFYHRYPIKQEPDPHQQAMRLFVADLFRRQMSRALELMGIPVPARM
jgi:arginyl-tRNA synthetase